MKIKEIVAFPVELPGGAPDAPARRRSSAQRTEIAGPMSRYSKSRPQSQWRPSWSALACVVTAEDGTWGLGLTIYSGPVAPIINEHFAPLLLDEECMAIEKLWDMMFRMSSHYGPSGLASYAISAVDLALWDLKGKLLDRPVYELLGGPARDSVICYATGNDTDWHMELGFKATKLSCLYGPADGLEGLRKNEELVAAARATIGTDVELMLDCWMALDLEFAVRQAERLRQYNLKWMEDSLVPDDFDGFAEMRRRLPWQTLATGEHWYTTLPFMSSAARRSVDIFQPDIQWVGGATAVVKICHIAEAAGISVMPHMGVNEAYGQHVCYAMPAVPWGELFVGSAPGVPLESARSNRHTPGMALPKDGMLVPSDAPGFGIELTLDELHAARV